MPRVALFVIEADNYVSSVGDGEFEERRGSEEFVGGKTVRNLARSPQADGSHLKGWPEAPDPTAAGVFCFFSTPLPVLDQRSPDSGGPMAFS